MMGPLDVSVSARGLHLKACGYLTPSPGKHSMYNHHFVGGGSVVVWLIF